MPHAGIAPHNCGMRSSPSLHCTPLLLTLLLTFQSGVAAATPPLTSVRQTSTYGSALPRFALFGWVSPPADFTSPERYAELAATGLNVTVLAWNDSGTASQNRQRFEITRTLGLKHLMLDNDLDSIFIQRPETYALADSIVSRYRNEPDFLGYYLGDEPPASAFPRLGEWFEMLRQRDPAHPAWNALGPRGAFFTPADFQAYVQAYVDTTHPAVICNNQYDFSNVFGDLHRLTENVAVMGTVARAEGIPFWGVVNLVEHWIFRHVTEGMLRWQIAQWIAGGATGIGYFTYWTPAPNAEYNWQPAMIEWGTGAQAPMYGIVTEVNRRLAPMGNKLAGMQWMAAQQSGSTQPGGILFTPDAVLTAVAGRATLGRYVDSTGTPCVFVANSDSASARTITLTLGTDRIATQLRDDASGWDFLGMTPDRRVSLALAAGDFVLLRLPTTATADASPPLPTTPRLALGVAPNPGRGRLRLAATGNQGETCLEILDVAGRVLLARTTAPGARAVLHWDGSTSEGGTAPPGVYLARARDANTSVSSRVVWLGAR